MTTPTVKTGTQTIPVICSGVEACCVNGQWHADAEILFSADQSIQAGDAITLHIGGTAFPMRVVYVTVRQNDDTDKAYAYLESCGRPEYLPGLEKE